MRASRPVCILLVTVSACAAAPAAWGSDEADRRAKEVEIQMTDAERFSLLHGVMALPGPKAIPAREFGGLYGAGYVAGVPRLGVPALHETDGGLGVTNPMGARGSDTATALPSSLALGASFNPQLARMAGALIGSEARAKGFNVLLGGGMNLIRDPRNGRNFEYLSEDPLLSGSLAAQEILGTQSQGVVSTVKHFALNANETNRRTLDALIDPAALRESDLLAFELAIERGKPGAIMCAYNKVNGEPSCGNAILLIDILKKAWGYQGWVMSDWGAVPSQDFANQGLDQQSGSQLDAQVWFDAPLQADLLQSRFARNTLAKMVRRILRSVYAVGAEKPATQPVDLDAHREVALDVARQGTVLLKNDGALPLGDSVKTIAVIAGHANSGVLSGGGSAQVTPIGGFAVSIPWGGEGHMAAWNVERYGGAAPLAELSRLRPTSHISYDPGIYPATAAALARRSDVAIVFATRFETEGYDAPTLNLPFSQDELISAVARANPNTIVVLETGNPIVMPWKDRVRAILAAWYPGQAGGQAIAEILAGQVNPSGRLPITFAANEQDIPRPQLPGLEAAEGTALSVHYSEGADVGYRWFAKVGRQPLYPFGYGLSYTQFAYSDLQVSGGETVTAQFVVRNVGSRAGSDVPQLYLTNITGNRTVRLIGFERVTLEPGAEAKVLLVADPRLLANFNSQAGRWQIRSGRYEVALAKSATELVGHATITLRSRLFGR